MGPVNSPGAALGRALVEAGADHIEVLPGSGEDPHAPPGAPETDLERLQERLLGGPAAGAEAGGEPASGDASLSFHACSGPLREVQALHDRILACLDEMPGLDASGIGILTPDPDLYAPLIRSVFEGRDDARRVPTAAISPERDSRAPEAFRAAARVLRGRFAAAEVIDLLEFAPLRERFGLAAEDVAALRERLPEAGVRWGLDAEHREQADQPADPLNTWRSGLDRLLLGWAGAGDAGGEDLGGVAPLETLDDEAGRWLGPLAELLSELAELRTRFREARSPREWAREIDRAVDRLLAPRGADLDALQALRAAAFDLGEAARAAGYDEPLPFAALTRELERSSGAAPGTPAQGLFGGGVTLAALGSAQGVPFRVLALCGLGADEFPRADRRPGFDLLREPRAGDPSRREEDRHLFRIALLSARERLILTWPGRDPTDGTQRAPSVLVEEMLEATAGPGRSPSDLVVRHPLHAHDPDYFRPGRGDERLFSFDDRACEAARAAAPEPRPRHSPFLPEGWPPEEIDAGDESEPSPGRAAEIGAERNLEPGAGPETEIDLEELDRFLRSPRRDFARRFLGLTLPREAAAPLELERVVLDALESWELGEELVSELRGGADAGAALERLRRAGRLPPGAIGGDVAGEVARAARRIAALADAGRGGETANLEVSGRRRAAPGPDRRAARGPDRARELLAPRQAGRTERLAAAPSRQRRAAWGARAARNPSDDAPVQGQRSPARPSEGSGEPGRAALPPDPDLSAGTGFAAGLLAGGGPRLRRGSEGRGERRKRASSARAGPQDPNGGFLASGPLREPAGARRGRRPAGVSRVPRAGARGLRAVSRTPGARGGSALKPVDSAVEIPLERTGLVEASAGTGKTFLLVQLYLRLLVEKDLTPARILTVTFTRAATAELRRRVRERIRAALDELDPASGGRPDPGAAKPGPEDPDSGRPGSGGRGRDAGALELVRFWTGRREARISRERVRGRLERALRGLDQAAIFTIHSFCQRALGRYPFEAGAEFEVEPIEDDGAALRRIAQDFWVRELSDAPEILVRYARALRSPRLTPDSLVELARLRQRHPDASLRPERPAGGPVAELSLDDWRRLLDEARSAWRDGGRERVRDLVCDRTRVAGTYFRANSVEGWLDLLGDALERGEPLIGWSVEDSQRDKLERFRTSFVEGQAKPGVELPRIDLLDALEALLAEEERLEGELENVAVGLARRFADEALERERALLRESGRATHDGIVGELHEALEREGGEALAKALREEFGAALIDEFQDTDARQYGIFERVFARARPAPPLLLIGDPKQAIYGFRGADVFAYLRAKRDAGEAVRSLAVNRRSVPGLVAALNRLYAQADTPFGAEIDYERVEAADDKRDLFRRAAPDGGNVEPGAALELVFVDRDNPRSPGPAEARVAARVAAHVADLLARGRLLPEKPGEDEPPEYESIEPQQVAVLCRTNKQVAAVFEALAERGIGASVRGAQSVAGSEEAAELERVLAALAEPGRGPFVRAALATRLLGLDAAGLKALEKDEAGWTRRVEAFADAGRRWAERGVLAGAGGLFDATGARPRLLAGFGGERAAANLDHLLELCHEAERRERLGPAALLRWLGELRAGLLEEPTEGHRLRLDRESGAVQVGTVHGAKGLEYDVVYVPWAWQASEGPRADRWWIYHDPGEGRRAVLDLGGPDRAAVKPLAAAEREEEDARLLYVALTRARQRCSVFCAPVGGPFARLLGGEPKRVEAALAGLAAGSGGAIEVVRDWPGEVSPAAAAGRPASGSADWRAREPGRPAAVGERTSSFSGLVHGAPEASDPRDLDSATGEAEPVAADSERVPLAELPGGARTGSALHEVFEQLDFGSADPEALRPLLERALERHGLGGLGEALRSSLGRAVLDALDARLGGDGGPRLRDLPADGRASELEFWLAARPATGGIEPATLAEVFERHGDPRRCRAYAAHARGLGFARLRGFLRGFVDLVFEHEGRWYVLDYKSNRLGERFSDYAPERLWDEMCARHYVLQYHLYALALHRLLRLRLPGYDYARHFGGAYYLFLRGMAPERPGHGIFFDRPPAGLMQALDAAVGTEGA